MKRLASIIIFCVIAASAAWSQVAIPISGLVISQYGQPVPGAQIRVCQVTSTGIPCVPTSSIFQDYNLSIPASNPYSADSQGNYTVYAAPIASPGLYLVQVSPQAGTTYSYVVNGNNAETPVTGCNFAVVGGLGDLTCTGNVKAGSFTVNGAPSGSFVEADGTGYGLLNIFPCIPGSGQSFTCSGSIDANQIGPVYQVDQFAGTTLAEKWNACNTAAIAAGGGTCDARNVAYNQAPDAEMEVGTSTQEPAGGVTFILPTSGRWVWGLTNSNKCGIRQNFASTLIGWNVGANPLMVLQSAYTSITGFTGTSGTLTFTTATAHGLSASESVTLGSFTGAVSTNNYGLNGQTVTVTAVGSATTFSALVTGTGYSGTGATGAVSPVSMEALYCTDSGAPTSYEMNIRAEGFFVSNPAGKMAHGAAYVQNLVDQASFSYISVDSGSSDDWDISGFCCGDAFDHISAGESGNVQGGYPLHIIGTSSGPGSTGPLRITNSTFNGQAPGTNAIYVDSSAVAVLNVSFDNVYSEKYTHATVDPDPQVKVGSATSNITFNQVWLHNQNDAGETGFENDSADGTFAVSNSYVSPGTGTVSINDVGYSRTYGVGSDGFITNYSSTYNLRPNFFSWLQTDHLTTPSILGLNSITPANATTGVSFNGSIAATSQSSGQFSADFIGYDNSPLNQTVLFASPFPYIGFPTGTASTSGGTIPASTQNVIYVTCAVPYSLGQTPGLAPSPYVTTTGTTSSITWTWTAPAACSAYGSPSYRIWPSVGSTTPTHYFTSTTNSYTQTTPASSGTAGTMPTAADYPAARVNGDGSLDMSGWQTTSQGTYNAAANPIPGCASTNYDGAMVWVSDATSAYGPYTSGGTNTIPVACASNGGTWAWYSTLGSNSVGISNITVSVSSGSQGGNSCSSATTATMTGVTTSGAGSHVTAAWTGNPASLTGWGSTGGMVFNAWASAANTISWNVCNQTDTSISYSAVTMSIGAQ